MNDNLSWYERVKPESPISIVSVPFELGSDVRGHAATPKYLADQGLLKMLNSIGAEISQQSGVSCPKLALEPAAGAMKNVQEVVSVARRTASAVEKAARKGDIVLTLGGDHAVALGSLSGALAAHRSLGVIYIDAHPDCNTHETTISGNIHGMVTSAAMGDGHPLLTDLFTRSIEPENMLFIGLKDFDQKEIEYLKARPVKTFTMLDIASRGLSPAMLAIDALARRVDRVWVSMDMDSIDAADAPGTGLPVPGGLTRREVLALAHRIGKRCRLAGIDLVEVVAAKDTDAKTAQLALEIIARFLGNEYSWYQQHYMDVYKETNVVPQDERAFIRATRREQEREA